MKNDKNLVMNANVYCFDASNGFDINKMIEKTIPNVNWRAGHSGELLSEEDAERLDELWNEYMK